MELLDPCWLNRRPGSRLNCIVPDEMELTVSFLQPTANGPCISFADHIVLLLFLSLFCLAIFLPYIGDLRTLASFFYRRFTCFKVYVL